MTHIITFYDERFSRLKGGSDVRAVPIGQEEVQSPHAGGREPKKGKEEEKQSKRKKNLIWMSLLCLCNARKSI